MQDQHNISPKPSDKNGFSELSPSRRRMRRTIKILLPLLVLSAGIAGAAYIKKSGPKPRKRPPAKAETLVRVMPLRATAERVVVRAMGTVIPARELVLRPRVSGEITDVHPEFTEGGFLKAGEEVLRIDPEDYRLVFEQKQSQVVSANYALKLELGHQDVAKREWQLINGGRKAKATDRELALRKPHLQKARADVAAARAELEQARLNLDRTRVLAPFNAVIQSRNVEIGSQVSAQGQLAELVGTDEYRVQVSVPPDRLRWITIPRKAGENGSEVRIRYGDGNYERTGHVIRLLSGLAAEGRMARLLVSVSDPLNLETPETRQLPLLIGDYVRVEIAGRALEDVFRIPRAALRDDARVWIAGADGLLSIRTVETVWRDRETVLVKSGLRDGERLILSEISAPVDGMRVRVEGSDQNKGGKNAPGTGKRKG
ncbi:efflux RND transporter periplasmic adaptor subun it [Desulfonema ishimotonii]|uniref:Efflux RND transporter periplasmic adaptor subun it n=1 Tax=Desulfonema ishimotonii TaxID=45657 RepID=A0A401G1E6_9BACT|nr:efflux RND transporter periplasmic adaptor subunit [Desulfonema ishimotonii]GBC63031.1 efflux RND transporter periplasmic adaptor subun it [Desulfonema ishimotonii]